MPANSGRLTSSQSTDVLTGSGFKHSLKLDCTTADTSIGANEWGANLSRSRGSRDRNV